MSFSPHPPRLCLVVEAEGCETANARLGHALAALAPATLVIAPAPGKALDAASAGPLVALAQARDIAALIEADAALARSLAADGVHVPWSEDIITAYEHARAVVGPGLIVGADAGRSRHDAMTLGEQGAEYVGFGIPPHVGDRAAARTRRLDLVQWWAEIFELPLVAFDVETPGEWAELAAGGADFIAVRLPGALTTAAEIAGWARELTASSRSPA